MSKRALVVPWWTPFVLAISCQLLSHATGVGWSMFLGCIRRARKCTSPHAGSDHDSNNGNAHCRGDAEETRSNSNDRENCCEQHDRNCDSLIRHDGTSHLPRDSCTRWIAAHSGHPMSLRRYEAPITIPIATPMASHTPMLPAITPATAPSAAPSAMPTPAYFDLLVITVLLKRPRSARRDGRKRPSPHEFPRTPR